MKNTFNNIKQFRNSNQYLSFLEARSNSKYFNYVLNGLRIDVPRSNFVYHRIAVLAHEKGLKDFSHYGHYDINSGNEVENTHNRAVYIHTSISTCCLELKIDFSIDFLKIRKSFWVNSNEEITVESVKKHVFEYINREIIYKEGFFRDIQIYMGYSKSQVKNLYPKIKNMKYCDNSNDESITKSISRKFGYYSEYEMNHRSMAKLASHFRDTLGKPKKAKIIKKFNPFFLDEFDGDVDEAEELFHKEYSELSKEYVFY